MFFSVLFCANYLLAHVVMSKTYNGYEHPDWSAAEYQPKVSMS